MQKVITIISCVGAFLRLRFHDGNQFVSFLIFYTRKKFLRSLVWFEEQKDVLVKLLLMKRGRYNRPFLHIATMGVLAVGVLVGPFLADTYPILTPANAVSNLPSPSSQEQSIEVGTDVFQTHISNKPRAAIESYTVQPGDTLSTVAEKFSQPGNPISVDTIKWANNLTDDNLTVGDTLKIMPVTLFIPLQRSIILIHKKLLIILLTHLQIQKHLVW
jgi:hypothetical protein